MGAEAPGYSGAPRPPIITIDGPGGAGKSTIARRVADRMGFLYIDTGAMYRALAVAVRRAGLDGSELDPEAVAALARTADIELRRADGRQHVLLDGTDVTRELRAPAVDRLVPRIAEIPGVRAAMVPRQRALAAKGGVVIDGRDTGTAVLPDAECKFFVTADLATRVRRRHLELLRRGERVPPESVADSLRERDERDRSRRVGPLRQAPDAVVLDTTHLTVEQSVARVLAVCRGAVAGGGGEGR